MPFAKTLAALTLVALVVQAQPPAATIRIDAAHPGAAISPNMFGIFFEDINFGADGGLYPELIKNRSFEFLERLAGWKQLLNVQSDAMLPPKGEMQILTEKPLSANNPHYLRLSATEAGFGVSNSGFRGIGVVAGAEYRFSAYVRTAGPQSIHAMVIDEHGTTIGEARLSGFSTEWKQYQAILKPTATAAHATFQLFVDGKGAVDLDMVSLYPVDTWNHRPNGLRKDLVQLLYDMHPGFIRFPGGCIVEGRRLVNRYRWKNTVGEIADRKTIINRWNNEFDNRPAPDYFQSFGLGFYEYFQLAEDVGAQPLPILNCGMACEFNTSETAPLDQMNEYVQDALDLIDFANGPTSSPWGKLRAQMGHPAPFHLSMIGVGNEQWGPTYLERYQIFATALKAKHPEIKLVVAAGPSPSGEEFTRLWNYWRKNRADIVDEHYYMSPDWFLNNTTRYDHYDRSGPKVFAGEYAAQTAGTTRSDNKNDWQAALSEAAFMTGLERNGDVVRMASYAPLLVNVDAWQWKPDAIWFDSLHSYGTPNYYVQRLFASNTGTRVIPVTPALASKVYTSAVVDERSHQLIVKLVNVNSNPMPVQLNLHGNASVITLASADLEAENTFDKPENVAPVTASARLDGSVTLAPYSLTIYRVAQ